MPVRSVVIGSAQGLHARPAKLLVELAARQQIPVTISIGEKKPVRADSMLAVLTLGATCGSTVTLHADDVDGADAALDALAELIAQDLDGDDAGTEAASCPS